jgi:transcriptional regulator GlxA family with amidase domain
MLEFTKKTIEQIAWAIGYEDPSSFRKVFHSIGRANPGCLRWHPGRSTGGTSASASPKSFCNKISQ